MGLPTVALRSHSAPSRSGNPPNGNILVGGGKETRRLQTWAARKGRILPKETAVKRQYEGGGPGLHVPSRNTGRGVHSCGKPKGHKPVSKGKPTRAQLR